MRTRRFSVRLGLVCTGLRGGCTVGVVEDGGAVPLGGEDRGVYASGVMLGPCWFVGSGSAVAFGGMLMIGRSMCARAAWMYSSCVSERATMISSVRRIL